MAAAKKRKVTDENHVFQSKWTEEYFFVLKTLLFVLFAMEKSVVLKNTILRGTMRQTTFHN
jgi:hypothetical protein